MKRGLAICVWALTLVIGWTPGRAQELSPRAYWPAPVGTKVFSMGYAFQQGDVVIDPSLPIEGASSESHGLQFGYLQVFSLAGRTANVTLEVPRADATFKGLVEGEPASRKLSGHADMSVRFGVNLLGAPAMAPEEFQAFRQKPKPVLGFSLEIQPPTGRYNEERLANLGTNRWAFKPELGYLYPIEPGFVAELSLGAWLYTDNDDFIGATREQDPLFTTAFHLVKRIRPGFWVSFDLTFYTGGQTTVDGETRDDRQSNIRVGATVAFPFKQTQVIRFAASSSTSTDAGGDFDSYLLAYVKAWR